MSSVLSSKRNKRRKQKRGASAKTELALTRNHRITGSTACKQVSDGEIRDPSQNIGMIVADLLSGKEKCVLCQKECVKLIQSEWETEGDKRLTWFICEQCQEAEKDNPLLQSVLDSRDIASCNEKLLEALGKPEMCKCDACLERLAMNSVETNEALQRTRDWMRVRDLVPKIYNSFEEFEEFDKEQLSEHLSRLIDYDSHLLFQRMECSVREHINDQKCRLLKLLARGYKEPYSSIKLANMMLDIYTNIVWSAESLSQLLEKLDTNHLSKFRTSWVKLNKCLFQSMVYAEPMIHRMLPELLVQIREATKKDTENDATSTDVLHKYLRFGDEMFQLQVEWRETERLIDEFTDQYVTAKNTLRLCHHGVVSSFGETPNAKSLSPPPSLSTASDQVHQESPHWDLLNAVQNGAGLPKFLPLLTMPVAGIPAVSTGFGSSSSVDPPHVSNLSPVKSMPCLTQMPVPTYSSSSTTSVTSMTVFSLTTTIASPVVSYTSNNHCEAKSSLTQDGPVISYITNKYFSDIHPPSVPSDDSMLSSSDDEGAPHIIEHPSLVLPPELEGQDAFGEMLHMNGFHESCTNVFSLPLRGNSHYLAPHNQSADTRNLRSYPFVCGSEVYVTDPAATSVTTTTSVTGTAIFMSYSSPVTSAVPPSIGLHPPPSALSPALDGVNGLLSHSDLEDDGFTRVQAHSKTGTEEAADCQIPPDGSEAPAPTPLDSAAEDESSSDGEDCDCYPRKCTHMENRLGCLERDKLQGECSSNNEDGSVSDSENDEEGEEYDDADDEGEEDDDEGECRCDQCQCTPPLNVKLNSKIEETAGEESFRNETRSEFQSNLTSFMPVDVLVAPASTSSSVGVCECLSCQQYASATTMCLQSNILGMTSLSSSPSTSILPNTPGQRSMTSHLAPTHSFMSAMQPLSFHRHLYSPLNSGLAPTAPRGKQAAPTSVSVNSLTTSEAKNGSESPYCLPLYQQIGAADWAQAVAASGGIPKLGGLMQSVNPTSSAWSGRYGFHHQITDGGTAVPANELLYSSTTSPNCSLIQPSQVEHDAVTCGPDDMNSTSRSVLGMSPTDSSSPSVMMQVVKTTHLGPPPSSSFAVTGTKIMNSLGSSTYEAAATTLSSVYQHTQASRAVFTSAAPAGPSFQFPALGPTGILHQPQFFHPGTTMAHKDGQYALGNSVIPPGRDGLANSICSGDIQQNYNPFLPCATPSHLPPSNTAKLPVNTSLQHGLSQDPIVTASNAECLVHRVSLSQPATNSSLTFSMAHQTPTTGAVADGKTSAAVAATTASVQQQIQRRKKLVAHGKLRQQGQKKTLSNVQQNANPNSSHYNDQSSVAPQSLAYDQNPQKLPQKTPEKTKPQLHMHLKFQFQHDQSGDNQQQPSQTSTIVYERPGELRAVFQHPTPPQGAATQVHNHTPQGSGPNVIVEYGNQKHILPLPSAISGYPPAENPEPGVWSTETPLPPSNPPPPPPLPPPPALSTTRPHVVQTPAATQTNPHKHPGCTGPPACTQNDVCRSSAGNGGTAGSVPSNSKYCDCCYCEFFGNGGPPPAPTSKNYPEMRERLRSKLNKKMQAEGKEVSNNSDSSDYHQQQDNKAAMKQHKNVHEPRDERSLEEILSFIEGERMKENQTDRSKKAVKKARQKLKKEEERKRKEREEAEKEKHLKVNIKEERLREQVKKASPNATIDLDNDRSQKGKKKKKKQGSKQTRTETGSHVCIGKITDLENLALTIGKQGGMVDRKHIYSTVQGGESAKHGLLQTHTDQTDFQSGMYSKHKRGNGHSPTQPSKYGLQDKSTEMTNAEEKHYKDTIQQTEVKSDNTAVYRNPSMNVKTWLKEEANKKRQSDFSGEKNEVNKIQQSYQRMQKLQAGVQKHNRQSSGCALVFSSSDAKEQRPKAEIGWKRSPKYDCHKADRGLVNGVSNHTSSRDEGNDRERSGNRQRAALGSSSGSSTPEQNATAGGKATSSKKTRRKKHSILGSQEGAHVDQVFLPKGDDIESSEMDDIEKEIDRFKRFCLDSSSIHREKKKISVNWKDFSFKKNHSSH